MKYISGNLDNSSRDTIKNALAGGTGEAIEKRLPHIMTGDDENIDYLGESIFILHYDIEDTGEYTLYFNNILPKRVFLDSEEIDPSENIQPLTPGKHIVEVYSSRYWEEINEVLFDNLPGLKKIEFPRPLKRFGPGSIQNCPNLETLVFGKNVGDLIYPEEGGYFIDCPLLNKIQVNKRNKNIVLKKRKYIFSKNDEFLLSLDGTLPTKGVRSLQKGWTGKTTFNNLVIPDSIETLGEGVFEGCTFTGSLTLGGGLKTIEEKAFYNINITELDTLIINPQDPPTIESPEYFDLRDIDENGDPIAEIDFETVISKKGLSIQYKTWGNYINFFNNNEFKFQYLTFEAVESGTFTFAFYTGADVESLSYSLDSGSTWTTVLPNTWKYTSSITATTPTVLAGNTVMWKGIAKKYSYYNTGPGFSYSRFKSTGKYNISGNILSLFYNDYFIGQDSFPVDSSSYSGIDASCAGLFSGYSTGSSSYEYSSVVDAHNLILPNTVTGGVYASIFAYCNYLTAVPELPATTLANQCYDRMFQGCTSLTTAPELPAMTMKNYCYRNMFNGCTSLTTAPELPATTLAQSCYSYMFSSCASLTEAPDLPATALVTGCYSYMFSNCSNLRYIKVMGLNSYYNGQSCVSDWLNGVAPSGTAVLNPASGSGAIYGFSIPSGWTVEYDIVWPGNYNYFTTTAIDNSAFTLTIPQQLDTVELKYIEYSTDNGLTWTRTQNSTNQDITITTPTVSAGNSVKWRGVGNSLGCWNNGPRYNCSFSSVGRYSISGSLNSLISCSDTLTGEYTFYCFFKNSTNLINAENLSLPASTLVNNCYNQMFRGCTSLTKAPELPATTLANVCYEYMFYGCSSLETAPSTLPATTLANGCYRAMFQNCTSLTTAPELPNFTFSGSVVQPCIYMFNGCSSLNYIKAMFTITPNSDTFYNWVQGVASSGTFIKNSAATWNVTGNNGIPSGWTVETASS